MTSAGSTASLSRRRAGARQAGALILLLAGRANIGAELLGLGLRRRREHAVQLAVGAWKGRFGRQVFLEAALLALAGTVAAAPVAAGVGGSWPFFTTKPGGSGVAVRSRTVSGHSP